MILLAQTASTSIILASMALLGVIITAVMATVTQWYLRKNLGVANGSGNLSTMVEKSLENQGGMVERITQLQSDLDGHVETDESSFADISKSLDILLHGTDAR